VGVEEVYSRGILPGYNISWSWRDTYCKPRQGLAMAVDLWSEGVDAFVGPGCSVVCEPVGLLSAAWNIPVVSFACASDSLSLKYTYPTFTRTVGPYVLLAPMFRLLAEYYSWDRVGVVTTTENIMQLTANAIKHEMEAAGKTVIYRR
jgi:ABC-type branched-subunit amino acid transport system substrate-binding protein